MAEQSAFDPKKIELHTLGPGMGLLEQLNLPPKAIAFIRKNQRAIWLVVSMCVVLAVAASAYSSYRDYRAGKAASALDAALAAAPDNRQMLESVAKEYGSTSSGLWAQVELAVLEEKEGQLPKAITRLAEINIGLSTRSPLKPLVLTKLAGLYENGQQFDKALALYTELAANEGFAPDAYRAMGRVNEQLGKKEDAVAMYAQYLETTGSQPGQGATDPIREMVQYRLNLLKK
jgi:predicted negative regulator of RcsB-dependent stress response